MNAALARQLRLVGDAVSRLDSGSSAEGQAARVLLAELIAEAEAPAHDATRAGEQRRLAQLEAGALAERDRPAPQNLGDALDLDAISGFLRRAIPGEDAVRVTSAETVSRGMSKKTVLIGLDQARTLPHRLALRVDRSANNYLGTTVTEEWGPLQRLWQYGARIPQPFAIEPTGNVLGDRFIVFAAATGVPVGGNYVLPARDPALIADVAACMAGVHAVPVDDWPNQAQPQGDAFFDAQFDDYLGDWQALDECSPVTDAAFAWIERHRSRAYGPPAFVHDDFNFNNMLVENGRVTAVLDWEFAHVGTAAADLSYFRYSADGGSTFADFLAAYAKAGGTVPDAGQLDFYQLWGQLRLVVMGFKAVRNLEDGHFDNVRYGMSRWHRRQGLLRISELLERLGD